MNVKGFKRFLERFLREVDLERIKEACETSLYLELAKAKNFKFILDLYGEEKIKDKEEILEEFKRWLKPATELLSIKAHTKDKFEAWVQFWENSVEKLSGEKLHDQFIDVLLEKIRKKASKYGYDGFLLDRGFLKDKTAVQFIEEDGKIVVLLVNDKAEKLTLREFFERLKEEKV
jgi:ubiquinone/menaquinone biosynthesis C-methylase UbiE